MTKTVTLICDRKGFRGADCACIRWLDWDSDFDIAQRFWPREAGLTREDWEEARNAGYRYCAAVKGTEIIAIAAEYRFSDEAWMLAAVLTAEAHRGRGYGRQVASFVTADILAEGRLATCETREDNHAMIRTAKSIGYRTCKQTPPGGRLKPLRVEQRLTHIRECAGT